MDNPKINDKNIDQKYQVIIGKCPEPAADPESAHCLYSKGIRLLKYPDQHATNQEAAQHEEQLHSVDQLDPGESGIGFFEHQSMLKHNKNDGKCPHDIEPVYPVFIIGMQEKNVPQFTDEVKNNPH